MKWLQRLTLLLENAQRALYGVWHIELLSARREEKAANFIAHRRPLPTNCTRTLYDAWKLRYTRPNAPQRRTSPARSSGPGVTPATLTQRLNDLTYTLDVYHDMLMLPGSPQIQTHTTRWTPNNETKTTQAAKYFTTQSITDRYGMALLCLLLRAQSAG